MTHKVPINLSEAEVKLAADIHKDITIRIAKAINHLKDNEKEFHLCMLIMAITFSSMMNSFGLHGGKGFESCLNDFTDLVKKIHKSVRDNAFYMEMRNGEIISEGKFQ